jgi:hypothetical protein
VAFGAALARRFAAESRKKGQKEKCLVDIVTEVATSSDQGATWAFVSQVNLPVPTTATVNDPSVCQGAASCVVSGTLVHETPSVIADLTDPDLSGRYKMFVDTYLEFEQPDGGGAAFHTELGYIGYLTAPTPAGPWSSETKLLGWNGSSTLSSAGVAVNVDGLPGMSDCMDLGEPGATVTPAGIDLALTCVDFQIGQRIELLRSIDHGMTWTHVSKLLDGALSSSECGAAGGFSGADLFFQGGVEYLTAVTGEPEPGEPNAYNACLVYRMANVDAGTLLTMGDSGAPVVLQRLTAADPRFFGPCTYAEGASAAGYLATEHYLGTGQVLRSYTTGVQPP